MTTRGILLLPALLVPLILVGVLARRSGQSDERWRRMEAWAEAAERGWEQRDFERAPAWGEAHGGAAFDAYARAVALATELSEADRVLGRRLRVEPEEIAPEEAEAFARRWAPALADLSRGAHLLDARPPVAWERGYGNETARLLVLRDLTNAATIEVRRLLARGDALAAVELALDAATFASDLLQSPVLIDQMVACALVAIATGETWREDDLRQLDESALSLLAEGIARIDQRCPLSADWRGEALLLANALSVAVGNASPSLGVLDGDAAMRELAAAAVLHQVELWQELESGGDDPWPARERALEAASNTEALRENPVLEVTMASWTSVERSLRSTAAIVRLLRTAVAHHRGDALPELGDPLGPGALEVERTDDGGLRVRSAGWPDQRSLERLVGPR